MGRKEPPTELQRSGVRATASAPKSRRSEAVPRRAALRNINRCCSWPTGISVQQCLGLRPAHVGREPVLDDVARLECNSSVSLPR